MKTVKAALVAAAMLLPASGAFAQQVDSLQMMVGLSMVEVNAQNAFTQYGIDGDVRTLSLSQLSKIIGIINDPERDSGGASAKSQIEAVLRSS